MIKKTILTMILCGSLLLGIIGCANVNEKEEDNLQDTYNKVSEYFKNENANHSNLGAYSLNEKENVVIVSLIENTKEKQEEFMKEASIVSKYIKFEQGGPYQTSKIDFQIVKSEIHNDIRFKDYYKKNDKTIYIKENIEEFYIVENQIKQTLKDYISNVNRSLEENIKLITNQLNNLYSYDDGGTTVYKLQEKDITIITCNTLAGNKDVYIGDYEMEYENTMCK